VLGVQSRTTMWALRENCVTRATRIGDNFLRNWLSSETFFDLGFCCVHMSIIALALKRFAHD